MPDDDSTRKPRLISEGPFFAQVWESVLFDPKLTPSAIVIYAVLQRYAGEAGANAIFPSITAIAERMNMDRDTVADSLKLLAERKHISREKVGRGWTVTIKAPKVCGKNPQHSRKISADDAENFRISRATPIKREKESTENPPTPPSRG